MRTIYLAGIVIAATALLNACTIGEDTPTATSTPTNTVVKSTDKTTTTNKNQTTTNKPATFTTAFVPGKGNLPLIEPTDKNKRQEELIKKNSPQINQARDPFAPIPGTVTPLVIPQKARPNLPAPVVRINTKPIYVAPDPTEAMGVSVSGVVEIAGTQYAIMSIPGESTTRYVKAGQRISNGQVLVKRIDTFGTPSVVLQQYGIEVVRSVGQVVAAVPTNSIPANSSNQQAIPAPVPASSDSNSSPINSSNSPSGVIIPPAGVVSPSGTFVPGLPTINQR